MEQGDEDDGVGVEAEGQRRGEGDPPAAGTEEPEVEQGRRCRQDERLRQVDGVLAAVEVGPGEGSGVARQDPQRGGDEGGIARRPQQDRLVLQAQDARRGEVRAEGVPLIRQPGHVSQGQPRLDGEAGRREGESEDHQGGEGIRGRVPGGRPGASTIAVDAGQGNPSGGGRCRGDRRARSSRSPVPGSLGAREPRRCPPGGTCERQPEAVPRQPREGRPRRARRATPAGPSGGRTPAPAPSADPPRRGRPGRRAGPMRCRAWRDPGPGPGSPSRCGAPWRVRRRAGARRRRASAARPGRREASPPRRGPARPSGRRGGRGTCRSRGPGAGASCPAGPRPPSRGARRRPRGGRLPAGRALGEEDGSVPVGDLHPRVEGDRDVDQRTEEGVAAAPFEGVLGAVVLDRAEPVDVGQEAFEAGGEPPDLGPRPEVERVVSTAERPPAGVDPPLDGRDERQQEEGRARRTFNGAPAAGTRGPRLRGPPPRRRPRRA